VCSPLGREWHERLVGRSVGRLFSGLANWFPAARLDYANRICVLAFDRSARARVHTHDARGSCVYRCTRSLARARLRARARALATHVRRARQMLRIRMPMPFVRAGILDREHP